MKVTVTDREVEIPVENREYPYIGQYHNDRILQVWFTDVGRGFPITGKSEDNVFKVSDGWCEELFTPLVNKTITIEV